MSLNCKQCDGLMSPYLDDRLDAATRAGVDAHLADCSACATSLRLLQSAAAVLAAEGPAEPPPGLAARAARAAFAAAEESEARPTFIERWIRVAWPAAAAASVATALLLVLSLGRGGDATLENTNGDPVALMAQADTETNEMLMSVLALEEE